MKLTEICIKRPVLSCVISLVLIVIGIMGFYNLSERYFPNFEAPVIHIITNYNGASASLMETSVTTPLEDAISGIAGIDTIESQSLQGNSVIKIRLKADVNQYDIASQVRNKISEAEHNLPDDVNAPIVRSGWNDNELMDIAVVDTELSPNAIRDYLDRYITNQIEDIEGIANVNIYGADKYAMRIRLNPAKMKALDISVDTAMSAIENNNVQLPAGDIKASNIDYPINAQTGLSTAKQFADIPIVKRGNTVIRLQDIGIAKLGDDSTAQTVAKYDSKTAVWMQIEATTNGNPITAANHIKKRLAQIEPQLPASMKMHIFYNEADFMQQSIHDVYISIGIAIICVMLIILLFLGSIRTAIIPIITIPVCLLATFFVIDLLGFSINVITLLALVLSIGLVVDDAIVMLENIYRHIEQGMAPMQAALKGGKEIAFAVIAMTMTLAAVYAPMGFIHSHTAIIYRSFAFTLASAVIISGFIALTLTPMMCSRFIKPSIPGTRSYSHWLEGFFQRLQQRYQHVLKWCLRHRLVLVMLALAITITGIWVFHNVPKQFMPTDDQGMAIAIVNPPTGANNHLIDGIITKATKIIHANPAVAHTISISSNYGRSFNAVFISLKPFKERSQSAQQITTALNAQFKKVPGLDVSAFAMSFGGSNKSQLEFSIMTSDDYLTLFHITQRVKKALLKYPGITTLTSDMNYDTPEYDIHVNRQMASNLNVSIKNIDTTIAALVGGEKVSTYNVGGKTYNVYVQARADQLTSPEKIAHFYVTNAAGNAIPLSNLITFKRITSQQSLSHYNRLRASELAGQIAPHYTLGQVVDYLQKALPNLLPNNASFAFMGKAKKLLDASGNMNLIFGLAFVFIYLVLSAQFESFLDPIVILIVVPLSVVAALTALKLFGGSRNIYTDIGLVTLIGLIAKHGILITQFANQLQRDEKLPAIEALIIGASMRLRPILMTTAAMIFGALPLLLASGASAHSREQIGLVIIAGLFFGTFFSLILVPVAYSYLAQLKSRFL